jgi:hypothetical protein
LSGKQKPAGGHAVAGLGVVVTAGWQNSLRADVWLPVHRKGACGLLANSERPPLSSQM